MTFTDPPDSPAPRGIIPAIGVICLLAGLTLVIAYCNACTPTAAERAESAIVVATYERELDACREQGRMSKSYSVYEACARAVDHRLCAERGVRCVDAGGAP